MTSILDHLLNNVVDLNSIEQYSVHNNNTLPFISQLWRVYWGQATPKSDIYPSFLLTTLLQTGQRRVEGWRFPLWWTLALWMANRPNLTPGPGKCPCRYSQKTSAAHIHLTLPLQTSSAYMVTCLTDTAIMNRDKLEWLVINHTWWTNIISRTWLENDYLAGFRYNIVSVMWENLLREQISIKAECLVFLLFLLPGNFRVIISRNVQYSNKNRKYKWFL